MKKSDLIKFYKLLLELKSNKTFNIKFVYAIQRNLLAIQPEINLLIEIEKTLVNDRVVEFENKRLEVAKEYAIKDENGNIVYNQDENSFNINNINEFNEKINELSKDYGEDLIEHDNKRKEYEDILQEEIQINFYKVDFEQLPDFGISAEDLNTLSEMINFI